ncbi:MAG: metal-dependent hydrolase [Vicinamibacterales bacterium]
MDPVSHALCGAALASVGPAADPPPRRRLAAVLGALAPDVDALLMPVGWDRYLSVHDRGTHSLVGAVVCGVLVGVALAWRGDRAQRLGLARAAAVGCVSHLVLDATCGGAIRPFWPVVDAVWRVPLVAMGDIVELSIFLGFALAWWSRPRVRRRAAAVALATVATLLFVKGGLLWRAQGAYRADLARRSSVPPVAVDAEADWGSLTRWHVLESTPEAHRVFAVDAARGSVTPLYAITPPQAPSVDELSQQLPVVRHALGVFAVPLVWEERDGSMRDVWWSDPHFCGPEPGAHTGRDFRCALKFGVRFDDRSRAIAQRVVVGSFVQSRPVGTWW